MSDWPEVGVWELDPRHTSIIFTVGHLVVSRVRGRFDAISGSFEVAPDLERSRLSVTIDAASINSGVAKRDGHLRSADFLEVDRYPVITYESEAVRLGENSAFRVDGVLTMHGVTRPVSLEAEFLGAHADGGVPVTAFFARASLIREEFGLTFNRVLEAGGMAVGSRIDIEITAEGLPAGSTRKVD
ncbi:YceI family protein [Rhizohabitans arisaemae]|uniref:YceI family protein n=1 Tax=Rhizohabitans arisaemae TaxID=2720610 RepID=UPI0024B18BE0|nr:YceI family protein [Rhizohabitans arisaemae]